MRFLSTFGRLPHTWSNLFLILISGIFEGFGLSLFIPLLHIMGSGVMVDLPRPFSDINILLKSVGIPVGTTTLLILIATLTLLALGLGYQQRKLLIKAKTFYSLGVRNDLFSGILDSSWEYSSGRSHGEILNRMTTECGRAGNALGFELMAVALILQISVYLTFSIAISWQLTAIAGVFGGGMFFAIRPYTPRGKMLGKRLTTANQSFSFTSLEYLRSLKLLKATAEGIAAKEGFSEKAQKVFEATFDSEQNVSKVYSLTQALPILLITFIIGVAFEILNIQVSVIFVFLIFMIRIAPRIAQVQQQIQNYHLNSPAVSVILAMINESEYAREALNAGGKTFESIREEIAFDNVTFKYADSEKPAVNDVSLSIGLNQTIAIVGSSGSGKSTVMDLLTSLRRPDAGKITIDGKNLDEFSLISWRQKIGVVTQETMIFNSSLYENLLFFRPDASVEDVERALSLAHLDGVVANLPAGMDTVLGEGGVRFSGGQIQRIALARALIRKPELLLLDEATSALDNETERYIQDSLAMLANSMTIVIVAHRLSTVRRADKIYVMENGMIVESGTYEELIANDSRFAELLELEIR